MIERERMEIQERGQWMWQQTPGSSGGQTSEVRKDTAFPDMDGTETTNKGLRGAFWRGGAAECSWESLNGCFCFSFNLPEFQASRTLRLGNLEQGPSICLSNVMLMLTVQGPPHAMRRAQRKEREESGRGTWVAHTVRRLT